MKTMLRIARTFVLFSCILSSSLDLSANHSRGANGTDIEAFRLHTFEALSIDIGVTIRWISLSEKNCNYYTVERSSNGSDYIEIAQVKAAGNTTTFTEYLIIDNDPLPGTSHYRIRQTDNEGTFRRSEAIVVIRNDLHAENINPVDSIIGFVTEDVILVRDKNGKEYFSKVMLVKINDEIYAIDPERNIPVGTYYVVASSRNQIRSSRIRVE
jgi:hypothetical protein